MNQPICIMNPEARRKAYKGDHKRYMFEKYITVSKKPVKPVPRTTTLWDFISHKLP